jgi:hypothetical protein
MTRFDHDSWDSEDPYIRAKVRGRAITDALAYVLGPNSDIGTAVRERIVAGDRKTWAWFVDPAGGWREPIHR